VKHVDFCMLDEYIYTGGYLENNQIVPGFLDQNTYINPCSYEVATYAAGSAIGAVNRSMDGECCFALIRPPGHHAEADRAMGFCLLNNAAIATAHALTSVDRVAIIDWDTHHGNGTQSIFYSNNRVLYCSIHERDTFPHTGLIEETGSGAGEGYTINAPIQANSTITDYHHVFSEIFIPAVRRFNPDLIIISAGQDMLSDDPVGSMKLVPEDVGTLMSIVRSAGDFPTALILEGGYGPSHPDAIRAIFNTLEGKSHPAMPSGIPVKSTLETVRLLKKAHRLP